MPFFQRFCLSLLVLCCVSACTTTPATSSSQPPAPATAPERLDSALNALQEMRAADRNAQALVWAEEYLTAERVQDADVLLENIDVRRLQGDQRLEWILLSARVRLTRQDADGALALLDDETLQAERLANEAPLALQNRYLLLRSDALALQGDLSGSLRGRVAMDAQLERDAQHYNRQMIWALLMHLPRNELEILVSDSQEDLRGWAELAQLYRDPMADLDSQVAALEDWERQWFSHPAALDKPQMVQALQQAVRERPRRVAVLLPFNGPLADAAQAIRDGMLTAYYSALEQGHPVPELRFIDSQHEDVATLYNQALVEGADFIIGPLERDKAEQLAEVAQLPVTTLTLNYTDQPPLAEQLYQFGLAPEDEARQVARQAYEEGARLAGVLYPRTDWGQRVAGAFITEWQRLGGVISTEATYDDNASETVKGMLSLGQSEARARSLRRYAPSSLEFEPRRRQDLDFLFMAANPAQGRQLKPALNFHYAGNLPVYSISNIYSGQPEPDRDNDLNGIRFVDLPWLLDRDSTLHAAAAQAWPQGHGRYERLFAMGVDAYRLQARLALLRSAPGSSMPGATGALSLTDDNRVERRLDWAHFRRGTPQRLPVVQQQRALPRQGN
ncbi:penicillin-binding protein activator [Alcanivorax sp. JB21]|uniref:penicillin-binding protein activator n=1 Tax=Alcanivorax limicola TaxID=2874102 RepID=UPI001CBB2DAE|nr:penicillin-binding protein activator [Alcanivorax limicola]MBZ2189651.1 penicillin-binding protein activator [Alcanivorax limicola]